MANYSGFGLDLPFTAASDMDTYQYRFVKLDTVMGAPYVNLATGGSNPVPIGVLQNDPRAGGAANVRVAGTTKLWMADAAAAAVSMGNFIRSGSNGLGDLATGSAFSAIALEDMTAGCGYITVLLRPYVSVISGTT